MQNVQMFCASSPLHLRKERKMGHLSAAFPRTRRASTNFLCLCTFLCRAYIAAFHCIECDFPRRRIQQHHNESESQSPSYRSQRVYNINGPLQSASQLLQFHKQCSFYRAQENKWKIVRPKKSPKLIKLKYFCGNEFVNGVG